MRTAADVDDAAVLFAFGCSLVLIVGVSLIWAWWESWLGRSLMSLDVAISLALAPAVLRVLFGLTTARLVIACYYAASLFTVGLIMMWRLVVVWRVQRGARR